MCIFHSAAGELATFGQDKEKAQRRQSAEEVLRKLRQLMETSGLPEYQQLGLADNVFVRLLATADINMAALLLERQELTQTDFKEASDVARRFTSDLKAACPKANVDAFVKEWGESAREPEKSKPSGAGSDLVMLEELDAGGTVSDALATIRKHGFNLGDHVARKGSPCVIESIFEIQKVESGLVICAQAKGVQGTKEVTKLSPEQFLAEGFEKRELKKSLVEHDKYPSHRPAVNKEYAKMVMEAKVLSTVHAVGQYAASRALALEPQVQVFSKPQRHVRTKKCCAVGSLVLVPDTMKVTAKSRAELAREFGRSPVLVKSIRGNLCAPEDAAEVQFALAPMYTDKFACAAWAVATTDDKDKANCMWTLASASSVSVLEWGQVANAPSIQPLQPQSLLPHSPANTTVSKSLPVAKKRAGSKASLESEASEAPTLQPPASYSLDEVFHVPVLVNHKHINSGEELLVYDKLVTKPKDKLDPVKTEVLLQNLKKRPREH